MAMLLFPVKLFFDRKKHCQIYHRHTCDTFTGNVTIMYACCETFARAHLYILSSVKIGHHFRMHCHVSSDVDDVI